MILSARILHEKTPDKKEPAILNFLADTSYGVYLFHWPFFIIFSQHLGNMMAALVTTIVSLILTALSFYILEPTIAGKEPRVFGMKMDLSFLIQADLLPHDSSGSLDDWNLRLCTNRWSF